VFIRHKLLQKFEGEGASLVSIFFDICYYTSSHWPDRWSIPRQVPYQCVQIQRMHVCTISQCLQDTVNSFMTVTYQKSIFFKIKTTAQTQQKSSFFVTASMYSSVYNLLTY